LIHFYKREYGFVMPQLHSTFSSNISWISRVIGFGPRFQRTFIDLLNFGYKCRIRLPLFISAGFVLCHIFSVYLPTVEINVEVVEENRAEEAGDEDEEEEEYSLTEDSDSDSDLDLAVFVEFVGERDQ